jgi:two-component system chemotaxis response regulator CheB
VAKPEGGLVAAEDFQRELIAKVKVLGRKGRPSAVIAPAPVRTSAAVAQPPARSLARAPTVLAIGASTGGPPALLKLFEGLRGAVAQPILLTQHMPATFTALLAEQLTRAGERPCAEGRDGERILPGHCYIAPGGFHMIVANAPAGPVIRLNQDPQENFCRPAVDPLFRSVAQVYGPAAMGLILTGMGADGARGCEALAAAGGRFAVQDEASSVVWGMPGAAAATGLSEAVLPLADIATWLRMKLGVAA